MEIITILLVLVLFATVIIYFRLSKTSNFDRAELQNLSSEKLILEERLKNSALQISEHLKKSEILFEENRSLSAFKGRYEHAQNEINFLRQEKENLQNKVNFLNERLLDLEKKSELLKQASDQLQRGKEEWQKDKETILFQLSEDLIKKNNEQQNQISANQQEYLKKITENIFKDFENVASKVVALNDEVKKSSEENNLLKSALLHPASAGRTSEITLENVLKDSNLKEKQALDSVGDYILQSHFGSFANGTESEGKRPDAIVFFPADQILVIDSKSSPYFLELEQARQNRDFEQEKIILNKIKDSFRRHLESLKKKEYTKFLFDELRSKNNTDFKISIAMFLQTERMLEIVREVDPSFEQKAWESGIMIVSPIGLTNLLSQARFVIDRIKQEKNIEKLKVEIRRLLDNIALIFKESKEVGKALNKALSASNKMTKNLNRGVYSAIKNISELGIDSKKSVDIKLLEDYEVNDEENEEV